MDTLEQKRRRAANSALLALMQQRLPGDAYGEYLLALAQSDLRDEAEDSPATLGLLPALPSPDAPVEIAPEPLVTGAEAPGETPV